MSKEIRGPTYFVLATLAESKKHGYGIIQGVTELSRGHTLIKAGTLYAMLDRLVAEGLIENAGHEIVAGRLRHYYQLTEEGINCLRQESRQRLSVARATLGRLRLIGEMQ